MLLALTTAAAHADPAPAPAPARPVPWYAGRAGHHRLVHLGTTAAFGLTFVLSETAFKSALAPDDCRWCAVPSFDRAARDALVWDDPGQAHLLSSLDAYVVAPIVGLGLLVAADHGAGGARVLDDILPVVETVVISQTLVQAIKFAVGRQRPYRHFGDPNAPHGNDENLSFLSGHSALGFSITGAAGMISHWRHYWTEPYVWGAGVALSLSTEYLRMGADKHYLSDVVAGGLFGLACGVVLPRLLRHDVQLVPVGNGAALAGRF